MISVSYKFYRHCRFKPVKNQKHFDKLGVQSKSDNNKYMYTQKALVKAEGEI
jgi:hypothetical protein